MVFYDSEGREFSIDLSRGVSHNELEHLRKMCDQYRFELICKDVLLSKSNEMLESALKEIRVTLGCNACYYFQIKKGTKRTYQCSIGGCNVNGKPDKFLWRGLKKNKQEVRNNEGL